MQKSESQPTQAQTGPSVPLNEKAGHTTGTGSRFTMPQYLLLCGGLLLVVALIYAGVSFFARQAAAPQAGELRQSIMVNTPVPVRSAQPVATNVRVLDVEQRDLTAHIIPAIAKAEAVVMTASKQAAAAPVAASGQVQQVQAAVQQPADTRLLVEKIHEYTVQQGDTLASIAAANKINMNTLLWANPDVTAETLQTGSKLTVPPADGMIYTVEAGDTLSLILSTFNGKLDEVAQANGLKDPYIIRTGQVLFLPNVEKPNLPAKTTSTANEAQPAAKPAAATGSFIWPTQGWISTYFMELEDTGNRHAGLDIANSMGTPVVAADGGVVTLAGWNGNYGNCIIIDHGNGFVTWYGHFSKLYVSAGDHVERGQLIGAMGTTGYSNGPHLHFELHLNGALVNPLSYLP